MVNTHRVPHTHLDAVVVLQTELSVSVHTVPVLCFHLQQQNSKHQLSLRCRFLTSSY